MPGTFLIGCCARGLSAAALAAKRGASHAARRGSSHAATPALDTQTINNAQVSAPSGKPRARAPSAATIMKEEILLDRADFSPGHSDRQAGSNDQRALGALQQATGLEPTGHLEA